MRRDDLIARVRESATAVREHDHPLRRGSDFFCLNQVAWMGEMVPGILEHIAALEEEIASGGRT